MGNVGRELTAHLLSGFHFFLDRHLLLLDLIDQRCKLRILIDLRTLQIDRIDRVYDLLSNTEGKNCRDHENQDQDPEDRTDSHQSLIYGTDRTAKSDDRSVFTFSCVVHGGFTAAFRLPDLLSFSFFHRLGYFFMVFFISCRNLGFTIVKNVAISIDPGDTILITK